MIDTECHKAVHGAVFPTGLDESPSRRAPGNVQSLQVHTEDPGQTPQDHNLSMFSQSENAKSGPHTAFSHT